MTRLVSRYATRIRDYPAVQNGTGGIHEQILVPAGGMALLNSTAVDRVQDGTDPGPALPPQSFMTTIRSVAVAVILTMLFPAAGGTQAVTGPTATSTPVFRVLVLGDATSLFLMQIDGYFELRGRLQRTLPAVTVTEDVRQIRRGTRSLARAIRASRRGAVQGEFFTVATSAAFKSALALIMNADVWAVIMDDNPGSFSHDIDGSYPEGKTHSTMPGIVLASLPPLPDGIEFRFLGRDLILYDAKANTIIDQLNDAIACGTCNE